MTCEEVEQCLVDFIEGDLPLEQANQVQRHLATCRACESATAETRSLLGDLGAVGSVAETPASQPPAPTLAAGVVIADFEIIDELGRGGMGVVYRARQLTLSRSVALKVLSPELVQSDKAVERFRREAQAAARLHHTNIVPVYAQGQADGHLYYAMELIAGQPLDEILHHEQKSQPTLTTSAAAESAAATLSGVKSGGRRDYREIARQFAEVAEALAHAHEERVIHRDIKPQNLILGDDGLLHITDFGLARLLDEGALTRTRDLVGTPIYMAPEQVSGKSPIDPRTDVYALGMTLYETLTLTRPFHGDTYEQIIHQVLHKDPIRPRRIDPRIPADLETICQRAIEKEPGQRFPDARDMSADLRAYSEQFPIASRRISWFGRLLRWTRRHPARAASLGLLIVIAALLPILGWFSQRRAAGQLDEAWTTLMQDYHRSEDALAEVGLLADWLGDRTRYEMTLAVTEILRDTDRAIQRLEQLVRTDDSADARYLLAWAYRIRTGARPQAWEQVAAQLDAADRAATPPTADGYFFKGVTLIPLDPRQAEAAFEEAIVRKSNFTQAWLQQGRAINRILYLLGETERYYDKGVARLQPAAQMARSNPYPWYLLSSAHRLAALQSVREGELAAAEQRPEDAEAHYAAAEQRFAACLSAAEAAQEADPDHAHGFAAEAFYHEAHGNLAAAVSMWKQVGLRSLRPNQVQERSAYQMRLHFWLGEHEQAAAMHAVRYSPASGYSPQSFHADELLFASLWDPQQVEQFAQAVPRCEDAPNALLLAAAFQLHGKQPPAELLDGPHMERGLPPRWTAEFLVAVTQYVRGDIEHAALLAVADASVAGLDLGQRPVTASFLRSAAHFFGGVRSLRDGDRPAAMEHLQTAAAARDNEDYCFRARLLEGRLRRDPAWQPAVSAKRP